MFLTVIVGIIIPRDGFDMVPLWCQEAGLSSSDPHIAASSVASCRWVQAFQRKGPQLEALKQDGITIEADRSVTARNFRLAAVSDDVSDLQPSKLIIVLVKAYSTASIFPVWELLVPDGVLPRLLKQLPPPTAH